MDYSGFPENYGSDSPARDCIKKEQQETEVYTATLPLSSAVRTGLEPATPGVTGRYSNQLNYRTKVCLRHLRTPIEGGASVLSRLRVQSYSLFFIPTNFREKKFKKNKSPHKNEAKGYMIH